MSIKIEDLLLIVFVIVDEWYEKEGKKLLGRTVGCKPTFSDSEMLTLMLAIDFFGYNSERRYLAFMRANYLSLFPHLVDQSQFNRRARSLRLLLNELRKAWAKALGVEFEDQFLLDTTPVVPIGYKRDKSHSNFRGSADYGYCASRKLHYFGYKFVLLTTLDGLPVAFELVPASTDERVAADEILDILPPDRHVWADKGFISEEWQEQYHQQGIYLWTAKRRNQHEQNPPEFDHLLNQVRQRIETANDRLKEGGRSIEHNIAITVQGLCARIIAKVTSLTLTFYLRKFFGIDPVTFTVNPLS